MENIQLKKFVEMAQNADSADILNVVIQALEAQGLYVFAELLSIESIKQMEHHAMHSKYFQLLNIFTYGTLQTYRSQSNNLPELTPAMVKKLKLLTLITLASDTKYLTYEKLGKELFIENIRELEDLLISAVYEDIIEGRLDQPNSRFAVANAAGRDVKQEDMSHIISTLNNWCGKCQDVLSHITKQVTNADAVIIEDKARKNDLTSQVEVLLSTLKKSSSMTSSMSNSEPVPLPSSGSKKTKLTK